MMVVFRILNKLLGAILSTLLFTPILALLTISALFNFIDLLFQGKILKAFIAIIFSPLMALLMLVLGAVVLLQSGWETGLMNMLLSFPKRIMYFFSKQLPFGTQKYESVNDMFVSSIDSTSLNELVTSGFFGKLTLKFLSLCLPMEIYLAYYAKAVSPHNDVSIYYTEKNFSILKKKYKLIEIEQSEQISTEINNYLSEKLEEITRKVKELSELPLIDDTRSGRLQSAKDYLNAIQAAQRCIKDFTISNQNIAHDLGRQFQCSRTTLLNYIWLAIKTECPDEEYKNGLKEKLIWTLFQIQRGYNIVSGGEGPDMPECPTGAIGLLVRVICDETEKMPNSEYEASDPTRANLTLALKNALDRPFTSSYGLITETARLKYSNDPDAYKREQIKNITEKWKSTFKPLFESGVLREDDLIEIIDTGVGAWEPPSVDIITTRDNNI